VPPNRNPIVAAQVPLTAIAAIVTSSGRAGRPEVRRPRTDRPAAIVANAASLAAVGATSAGIVNAKLALKNTPIHAHMA
jgi:hypothetical protein